GTTTFGGANSDDPNEEGDGTVFSITAAGVFNSLYSFSSSVGFYPFGNVVMGTDGALYGTVSSGGSGGSGYGAVYKLTLPVVPSAPTNLTATAGNASVSLTWTGSTGATSYNVLMGTSAGGES